MSKVRGFFSPNYPTQIALALGVGSLVGWLFQERVVFLGDIGLILIQLIKALATPLIFFAIVNSFVKTPMRPMNGIRLLTISGINAIVAGFIALGVFTTLIFLKPDIGNLEGVFPARMPGGVPRGLPHNVVPLDLTKALDTMVPESIFEPFVTHNALSTIILAIFTGIVLKKLKKAGGNHDEVNTLERFFGGGLLLSSGMLKILIRFVPLAVFGVIAKIVGTSGFAIFSSLAFFVVIVSAGLFIHAVVYYSFLLFTVARVSPLQFMKNAQDALVTAFATGSSLATLPVTLRTLREKLKVSDESASLAACVGTNLNHDGILLYEAIAALFVAHVNGIQLVGTQKILLLGLSAMAAFGIAGVPDAGLITLSIVLSSLGLPLTLVPVLMTVDWLIGRLRATVNVTSDMVVATILDRYR